MLSHKNNLATDNDNWRETQRWEKVMPGDVVQSHGTVAKLLKDMYVKNEKVKVLTLAQSPVFVLSRHVGVPGETDDPDLLTFVCLSRHGLIVVTTSLGRD